jgi:hypothetical protein
MNSTHVSVTYLFACVFIFSCLLTQNVLIRRIALSKARTMVFPVQSGIMDSNPAQGPALLLTSCESTVLATD